ncbi:zinc-finger double domain-containing protein [Phthorimaea operculella]|nr:zinc-finger double domain-containing protein [Phthorimaea operculella]
MRCVSVIISVDDDLPKMICEECVQELDTAFRFVERCEATDRALRNFPLSHNVPISLPITYQPTDNVKHEPDDHIYDEQFLLEDFKTDPQEFHCQIPNEQPQVLQDEVKETEPKKKTKTKKIKRGKNGPIRCVICSYMASCRSAMETHMRSHTGEKPYPCDICHQKFTTKGGRKRHIVNNHSERERRFTCETCGNSFFSKADIITHMRIHTDEKPYVCPECSKQFRQIASLIRHKRIHTGEKPFPCPVCGWKSKGNQQTLETTSAEILLSSSERWSLQTVGRRTP